MYLIITSVYVYYLLHNACLHLYPKQTHNQNHSYSILVYGWHVELPVNKLTFQHILYVLPAVNYLD